MLKCLREFANIIVCSYSQTSYFGVPSPKYLLPLLLSLKHEGLIDDFIEYKFEQIQDPHLYCQYARDNYRILKAYCIKKGCTHFLGCDCDEYYDKEQLKNIKTKIKQHKLLIAPIIDYVKTPILRAKQITKLYVPFIHDITMPLGSALFPVLLDESRKVKTQDFYIFKPKELLMHHMTAVRFNITELKRKMGSHSHFMSHPLEENEKYIQDVLSASEQTYDVVDDRFNILTYWKKEFEPLYMEYC
jgi:hypothetical protein